MTPIQAQSLPAICKGLDVIAQAKTGSGKTVAFGLGVLHQLKVNQFETQSLILCPTRELADQVAKALRSLARLIPNVKILTLCGGMPIGPQISSLKHGAHIVVGTPGRVLKHLDKKLLSLKALDSLVLDEADRMLDMGFIDAIKQIIGFAPKQRQTLLFSATYSDEIRHLSAQLQTKAVSIETSTQEVDNPIAEYFFEVAQDRKLNTVIRALAQHQPENVIVFCNTKVQTKEVANYLNQQNIDALAIHGDLEQYQRHDVLVQFANRSCSVLVATDVAARGIDIKALSMVVNVDLPFEPTVYTHRIGRTGRAGETGIAITIFTSRQSSKAENYRNESRHFDDALSLAQAQGYTLKAAYKTLVIEAGKKNKLRPGDILGSLSGDADIDAKYIGKIDVYNSQSYVAVSKDEVGRAYSYLKQGKVKGRKFPVWVLD